MTPTDPDHLAAAEELAELRRRLDVGLARIDGQLALHSHRDGQADRELAGLTARVTALEHTRWPLPTVAALGAAGSLAAALWQMFGR
ncbi:hypothetical protein C6N75_13805 [Streptomyces solincola]|uniref:Uncharacterized protein n=1 Tax=Streptomyces solincola TaxID=2100817 RepID=A0A2S9PW83_9ACTN|nr:MULTISPECIES: hypothetical protein [Streptomyces]PRH78668.1 hypothetical protein C6N75_13805 [Streptomyces solincola]